MVIDDIKRMRWEYIRHGGKPTKITMNVETFNEMVRDIRELIAIDKGDHAEYKVCEMKIEIKDDMPSNVRLIVS